VLQVCKTDSAHCFFVAVSKVYRRRRANNTDAVTERLSTNADNLTNVLGR
jgi:hypothetical protein